MAAIHIWVFSWKLQVSVTPEFQNSYIRFCQCNYHVGGETDSWCFLFYPPRILSRPFGGGGINIYEQYSFTDLITPSIRGIKVLWNFCLLFTVLQCKYTVYQLYQELKDFMCFIKKYIICKKIHSEFQTTEWIQPNGLRMSRLWLWSMNTLGTLHDFLILFDFFWLVEGLEPKGDWEVVRGKRYLEPLHRAIILL